MRDTIKMHGRLLIFDKPDTIGCMFPKDCKISFPEVVPITWEFAFNDPGKVIGNAYISKDEKGLICDAIITNFDRDTLSENFNNVLPIGGYYNKVKQHLENGTRIVDEATLHLVGVTLDPADPELRMMVIEKDGNLSEKYKTCGRCVHDGDDPDNTQSYCYMCRRNFNDNRIDNFELKKEKE